MNVPFVPVRGLLGTVAAVAALLGLPMLGVFRWVYGPWNGR